MSFVHSFIQITLTLVLWTLGIPVAMVSLWLKKPHWLLIMAFLCKTFFHSNWWQSAILASVILTMYRVALHGFHSAKLSYENHQDKKFKKRLKYRRAG